MKRSSELSGLWIPYLSIPSHHPFPLDERDRHLAVDPLVHSARERALGVLRMSFFLYFMKSDIVLFGI